MASRPGSSFSATRGEGELELRWTAGAQVGLAALLTVAAVIAPLIAVQQPVPGPAAVVIGLVSLAFLGAGVWLWIRRRTVLRIDARGITVTDLLSSCGVPWTSLAGAGVSDVRGSTVLLLRATVPIAHRGATTARIVLPGDAVPLVAEMVEHWTGRPLNVVVGGRPIPYPRKGRDG